LYFIESKGEILYPSIIEIVNNNSKREGNWKNGDGVEINCEAICISGRWPVDVIIESIVVVVLGGGITSWMR
jgi:hypothetical protein